MDTKESLHRFAQVVGNIRMAASVRRNHWWHVPFHVTGRGIISRPMGQDPIFTIDFDFVDHRLSVHALSGRSVSFPLGGRSVASFYSDVEDALGALGISVDIDSPNPFDLPDAGRPFSEDTQHATYDPRWVTRYWQVLSQVNLVLESFAARFSGKTSPVHHFWHTRSTSPSPASPTAWSTTRPRRTRSRERLTPVRSSVPGSGSATRRFPSLPSTPTPRLSPMAWPTKLSCRNRPLGGPGRQSPGVAAL